MATELWRATMATAARVRRWRQVGVTLRDWDEEEGDRRRHQDENEHDDRQRGHGEDHEEDRRGDY